MAHEWDRGVLVKSAWHGLSDVGAMPDAAAMVAAGQSSGAWPVAVRLDKLTTPSGLVAPRRGVVASYAGHPERCLGVVGNRRYTATEPAWWAGLMADVVAAGGKPVGAFALAGGSKVLGTFEVGTANGLRSHLCVLDTFDGSGSMECIASVVDVVCANTLAMAKRGNRDIVSLRHTRSLGDRMRMLGQSIDAAVKLGESVRAAHSKAGDTIMTGERARLAFDLLFPPAAAPKDPKAPTKVESMAASKAEAVRKEARTAAALPINRRGARPGTLATLWNAATYLVDRRADGSSRTRAGVDPLDSLVSGSRGDRVTEIQHLVEVIMADGTTQAMHVGAAVQAGVDPQTLGAAVIADMLG